MRGVRDPKQLLHDLQNKKQKRKSYSTPQRIRTLIEKELHEAQLKHDRSVKHYVIFFSIAIVVLTVIYLYFPQIPRLIMLLNLLAAIAVFFFGILLLSGGYKREIKDYLTIEEQVEKLRK